MSQRRRTLAVLSDAWNYNSSLMPNGGRSQETLLGGGNLSKQPLFDSKVSVFGNAGYPF